MENQKAELDNQIIEKYFSMCKIPHEKLQQLSLNFQSVLSGLGRTVCGDENLLHFTGDSKVILQIVTKPNNVGILYYELMVVLPNDRGFLIYFKMRISIKAERVAVIIQDWGGVVLQFDESKSVLVFGSYRIKQEDSGLMNTNCII